MKLRLPIPTSSPLNNSNKILIIVILSLDRNDNGSVDFACYNDAVDQVSSYNLCYW